MKLPKVYQPKKVEDRIYKFWEKTGFFNPDKLPKGYKKPFTIVIPPPNITGSLHMGHALNATCQDILIRWRRMEGYKTLWLPGIDHAGIATQNVVEKELKKEGLTRFDLGREKFLEKVWQWKTKYGNIILEQFKKLGCSLDWSRTKFTLDKEYFQAVKEAFLHYYKKGWIYRGEKPVNWCPRCQTSLSDLEIEYREEKGYLWFIRYPLAKNSKLEMKNEFSFRNLENSEMKNEFSFQNLGNSEMKKQIQNSFVVVATTRPETMLGDTALAVNPKDARYKDLIKGQAFAILPLVNQEIPIIADNLVDPKFGSGVVKVTPAHDLTDYEISLKHNLPMVQVISEEARITEEAPPSYQGLKVLEAREKIVEDLEELGLIEKVEDYSFSLPKCSRCQTTLEILPSWQWFLKMRELAKVAEIPVKKGKIKFYPKSFEKGYFHWLKNIKDWCISRQIWWGHQFPVWHCQTERDSKFKIQNSKLFENWKSKIEDSSTNTCYLVSLGQPKKCPFCGKCEMKQSTDVLDTWFSSALWPFAVFGWPKKTRDLKIFYPTNVLSTDRGIINLWVARMIFSGMEFMKRPPFKDVYIHATVLTREGKRMSKSLGTGIDPINLIEKYGADATRWGISWQIMGGQDIRFVEDNIVMGRKFCNKIWNASRFVLMQLQNSKPTKSILLPSNELFIRNQNLTKADRKILTALDKTIKLVNKDLENFRFGPAAHKLYNFFWHDFCDVYIEKFKIQKSKLESQKLLLYVLLISLKLLHPFMPFITEEIYRKLPLKNKKKCLMIEQWPKL